MIYKRKAGDISMKEKLTLKQKKFADEYIICGNATKAAVKAGYSEKYAGTNADKLLKNTKIEEYLNERLKKLEDASIAKQDEVLKYLTAVLRGTTQSTVVVVEGEGDGVSSARLIRKPPDEKERLKAADLLGKRYGLFTDKVELDAQSVVIVDDVE